jgi:hypothetical protein
VIYEIFVEKLVKNEVIYWSNHINYKFRGEIISFADQYFSVNRLFDHLFVLLSHFGIVFLVICPDELLQLDKSKNRLLNKKNIYKKILEMLKENIVKVSLRFDELFFNLEFRLVFRF